MAKELAGGGIIEMWGPGYIIYIDLLPQGAGLCPHNNYFLPMPLVCPYPPSQGGRGSKTYAHLLSRGTNSIVDNIVVQMSLNTN